MCALVTCFKSMGTGVRRNKKYRRALDGALAGPDRAMATRCLIRVGDLYRVSGRFTDALKCLLEARDELDEREETPSNLVELARVTGLICDVLTWLARYVEAEQWARRQLSLAEKAGDMAEIAAATANLGTVYARRTQYDEALEFYERNLELERKVGDPARLHQAESRIGNLYRLRGQFDQALEHIERQLSFARNIGNGHAEALAASNMFNILQEQGKFDEALGWLQKALAIYRRLGDRQREAASLGNLGIVFSWAKVCPGSEVGVDMSRFPSAEHLCSWAKVCPGSNESAGKRKSGATGTGNRYIRATLAEAAWAAASSRRSYLGTQFGRIAHRRGKKRAVVAVSNSIPQIIYYMLRDGTDFHDLGPHHFDERSADRITRSAKRRLEGLGWEVHLVKPAA